MIINASWPWTTFFCICRSRHGCLAQWFCNINESHLDIYLIRRRANDIRYKSKVKHLDVCVIRCFVLCECVSSSEDPRCYTHFSICFDREYCGAMQCCICHRLFCRVWVSRIGYGLGVCVCVRSGFRKQLNLTSSLSSSIRCSCAFSLVRVSSMLFFANSRPSSSDGWLSLSSHRPFETLFL